MKKLLFSFVFAALFLGVATAQEQEVFSAKLKNNEVPQAVTSALERDFPGMIASNFRRIPVEFVEGSFMLTSNAQDAANGETYYVEMNGPRFKAEATYDGTGTLIYAKEYLKNVALPLPVQRAINKDYPGWSTGTDHEMLTINRDDQQKAYYRVELTKGKEKVKVTYDANGQETKAGKERRMHGM